MRHPKTRNPRRGILNSESKTRNPKTGIPEQESWNKDQRDKVAKKYKAMPEQFYTQTGLPVVTPENFDAFMAAHKDFNTTWDLQERCSGSGSLSAQAHKEGLCV